MRRIISCLFVALMMFSVCSIAEANSISIGEHTPEWLAEQYNALSTDAFIVRAEYHSELDVYTLSMQSTDIPTAIWQASDSAVRRQYEDIFRGIVEATEKSLDGMGYPNTTVVSTFQLCDGNAIYMMIDTEDFSSMVSD